MAGQPQSLPQAEGYRGIWYSNQPSGDEYVYKYSGGFATYPQQHVPIAHYAEEADKTFFCYGGSVPGNRELLIMVGYYDHATGLVPRPTILLDKKTGDAHDNPTMSLDHEGYIWIFSNAHGRSRPAFIHRSAKPYSIDAFELVKETNFSYGQPWHVPGQGFVFLHTRYSAGRRLFWMTSPDGRQWNEPSLLSSFGQGHYQVSWQDGNRLATAFNYHPNPVGLNARTNLYYVETRDAGRSWKTVDGQPVEPPLTAPDNIALVRDYESEGQLVYLKDLQFDADGRPVLLYLTSKGYKAGPANDPRMLMTARWAGKRWEFRPVTTVDHNYDFGSFYIEPEGTWRMIAPTEPGPQPYCTGGEMALWTSPDQGATWRRVKSLTRDSRFNHTYARRPVNAHPDFYALWADGHAKRPSESRLYFTDREGSRVWQLPTRMTRDLERPVAIR